MNYDPSNPLIVQGDRSILVEVDNPRYSLARDALAPDVARAPEVAAACDLEGSEVAAGLES